MEPEIDQFTECYLSVSEWKAEVKLPNLRMLRKTEAITSASNIISKII
jgi:hypothetical protein